MQRDERGDLAAYRFDTLPADRLDALVSTRRGGASAPPYDSLNLGLRVGDEPANVVANRRALFATYGLELARSVWCRQVHGTHVSVVGAEDAPAGAESEDGVVPDTDALVTDAAGVTLCVTVADCVPVLLYDPARHVIGLVHAGWSGTVGRIASRTVQVMRDRWDSDPNELQAAVGPSISPADYEVGEDVVAAARAAFGAQADRMLRAAGDGSGKAMFDLWEANALDLESAGVSRARIEVAGVSTASAPGDFYSHRAEGTTGRFAALATLR